MKKRCLPLAFLFLFALLLCACGQGDITVKDIAGTWKIDFDKFMEANPQSKNEVADPNAQKLMREMFNNMEITIDADKKVISASISDIASKPFEVLSAKGATMRIRVGSDVLNVVKNNKDSLTLSKEGDPMVLTLNRK